MKDNLTLIKNVKKCIYYNNYFNCRAVRHTREYLYQK